MQFFYRTPNVVQFKDGGGCTSSPTPGVKPSFGEICPQQLDQFDYTTMFAKEYKKVDCTQTWWGVFHFTYEMKGVAGVCDSPQSEIRGCYDPGTPHVGNELVSMTWGECPELKGSVSKEQQFKCLGAWEGGGDKVYAAIWDLGEREDKFAFRCLITSRIQQLGLNKKRWSMSRIASCQELPDIYGGHYTLVLTPKVPTTSIIVPHCRFPANFTGVWYTSGERDSVVTINATHIHFHTKIDQYTLKDTYYICQQHSESRYLLVAVTLGVCEVDFICFDFLPRHQNVIRFRLSKPFRFLESEMLAMGVDYMEMRFRRTCAWVSFNTRPDDYEWKYRTFLMYPPVPIECPIAGRYKFNQTGQEPFRTRFRGITDIPRMQVLCRKDDIESDFAICRDTKVIRVDTERCMTMDYHARPIGEYDIPDHELVCVGYWMEDIKSYMITYEKDDSISPFRCWVYEQKDYRQFHLSRSLRSACGFRQTAQSTETEEGASIHLYLDENERMHDECPQRYDIGRNPYQLLAYYFPINNANRQESSFAAFLAAATLFLRF